MTETLEQRITRHEGERLKPYLDTTGHWTIGIGHQITECQAQSYANGISEAQSQDLLHADIAKAKSAVANDLPWSDKLPQIKQEVLAEMCFQLGMNGLLGFKDLLDCANCGDNDGVVRAMLDSKWHKQAPDRVEELAALWLHGDEA